MKTLKENDLAIVLDICFEIHKELGPGLLESVYEEILCYDLTQRGIPFQRQKGLPVLWKAIKMDLGYRTDVIIDDVLLVELKSVEVVTKVHAKITLTYLRLSKKKLGLLINFNVELLRDGITRLVNNL
jgi:GxxExxY protein